MPTRDRSLDAGAKLDAARLNAAGAKVDALIAAHVPYALFILDEYDVAKAQLDAAWAEYEAIIAKYDVTDVQIGDAIIDEYAAARVRYEAAWAKHDAAKAKLAAHLPKLKELLPHTDIPAPEAKEEAGA